MIVELPGREINLPDFFIAGVSRSGSTSLYFALKQHPRLYFPLLKEPFFFNGPYFGGHNIDKSAVGSMEDYIRLYSGARDQVLGEATTAYLYSYESVIPNIKNIYGTRSGDIKVILMLRNPAERAFSHYKLFVRDALEPLEFEDAIRPEVIEKRRKERIGYDYLGFGMYYEQVKAFLDNFPEVRVFIYEDYKDNNMAVIKKIFRFLGVDEGFSPDLDVRYNVSGRVKIRWLHDFVFFKKSIVKDILKPFIPYALEMKIRHRFIQRNTRRWEMLPETRKRLHSIYEDDIYKLQGLLNKDLSSWLK